MTDIPSIQNIDKIDLSEAKHKLTKGVSGFCVSIFTDKDEILGELNKAEKAGADAAQKIQNTNEELNKTRNKVKESEEKQNSGKAEEKKSKQKEESLENNNLKTTKQQSEASASRASTEKQTVETSANATAQEVHAATDTGEKAKSTITQNTSEIEALIQDSRSAQEELDALQGNDGTGSGINSALTLKTGAEIQEIQQKGDKSKDNGIAAQVQSKIAQVQDNQTKIDAKTAEAKSVDESAQAQTSEATQTAAETQAQAQESSATAATAKDENNKALDTVNQVKSIAGLVDVAGVTLNSIGVGVMAAGAATTAAGAGVGATGAVLTGVGAALSAIGIPLIPVFGAGVPVEAGGVATTAGGTTTIATGGTVGATGGTITSVGTMLKTTGSALSTTAKTVNALASATATGIHAANGEWEEAAQSFGATVNIAAGAINSLGAYSQFSGSALGKMANFASEHSTLLTNIQTVGLAISDGSSTIEDIKEGDYGAAISDGLGFASDVLGFGSSDKMSNASDIANGLSYLSGMTNDIVNGDADAVDLTLDGLSALSSFSAVKTRGSDNDITIFGTGEKDRFYKSDRESDFYKTASKARGFYDTFFNDGESSTARQAPAAADGICQGDTEEMRKQKENSPAKKHLT